LKKERKGRHREGPATIARLGVEVSVGDPARLREEVERVCAGIALTVAFPGRGSFPKASKHTAYVTVRRSLLGAGARIAIRFDPPIHVASCREIVGGLAERFDVTKVSVKEGRVRLPPRAR